ncbi:MAG TPA: oligoendopeptidase F [Opitutaceae bacterium]|nr:oligoendopeptidase F [Opitutaceae bacterium]
MKLLHLLPLVTCLHLPLLAADTPAAEAPVNPADVWDLTLLYPNQAAFDTAKAQVEQSLPKIETYKGHLGEGSAQLFEAVDTLAHQQKDLIRLMVYAALLRDENTRLAGPQEQAQSLDLLGSKFSQAASYLRPEVLAIGETKIRAFLAEEPRLAPYRFELLDIVRNAPHTLGAEAEGVLSATGLISDTPSELYGIFANADLPWPTIKLSDGKEVRLDQTGYTQYRALPERADREAVFTAFWGKMREFERTFGVSLFSQVKTDWFYANVRKHKSSLEAALSSDNVPESVYRTLVSETNANLPTLHRYFKLRARMLGISDLRYHDIYPALVKLDRTFSIEEARELTLTAVQPLGDDYAAKLRAGFNGRYMHLYPQPGKRAGAYMNGSVHDAHPYVLMNFSKNYDSVSTLAHEWGHAMHSVYSHEAQPFQTSDYSIFVAEIASTLNETLLQEHMLKIAKTDEERLYYLGNELEALRGTFFRQAMFAEFEMAIHEAVEKGEALSGEKFGQIYGDLLRRYHGHDQGVLTIDDRVTVEWAFIPHFYRAFYVYQYATSIAAAQAFAQRILDHEPGAVDTYLGLLKAGGSDYPYDLVKRAGVDLATPAPYRALVARMNRVMDEIEAILAKQGK